MADPQFEGMDFKDLEPSDLLEVIYGAIRDVVEVGNPDNVIMNYFMPPRTRG